LQLPGQKPETRRLPEHRHTGMLRAKRRSMRKRTIELRKRCRCRGRGVDGSDRGRRSCHGGRDRGYQSGDVVCPGFNPDDDVRRVSQDEAVGTAEPRQGTSDWMKMPAAPSTTSHAVYLFLFWQPPEMAGHADLPFGRSKHVAYADKFRLWIGIRYKRYECINATIPLGVVVLVGPSR
jgi:hypothetical protein